jgi:hypothetical protein
MPRHQRRIHLTHQERLVREIIHRVGDVEAEMADLRNLWRVWDVPRISRITIRIRRVLEYTRTGMDNPTNRREYDTVLDLYNKLNDFYLEAMTYVNRRARVEAGYR